MSNGDKFVWILLILAFLASEGLIPQTAPEDYIKDELKLNFLEDISQWSSHFDRETPLIEILELLWIFLKHFWVPAIIAIVWAYIKKRCKL